MTAATITHPAGTATPLLTMPGWFSVDVGDWMPAIVEGEQQVRDLLDVLAESKAARR